MTVDELARVLSQKIENGLPGKTAHEAMAANLDPADPDPPKEPQQGAVGVLCYPEGEAFYLLLTARAHNQNPLQGGTIGFPGVRMDPAQQTTEQAAREALLQELGLAPDQLTAVGALTSLYIASSRIQVYPYFLIAHEKPAFQPDQAFVQELVPVPFQALFEEQQWQTMEVPLADGRTTKTAFFTFKGARIWGPTAMILNEVIQLLGPLRVMNHTDNPTSAN
jgi:8-oxo-dGTP pyrophosphatase MutT (NUDIX family)